MSDMVLETLKKNKFSILSACGSIASIIALAVVILGSVVDDSKIRKGLLAWRIVFFLIALLGIAGSIVFIFFWVKEILVNKWYSPHKKTFLIFLAVSLGFVLIGIFLDGLFANIYWYPWLSGVIEFLGMLRYYF